MNTTDTFAAAINCIDGRVQIPVADWVKFNTGVQYVDMITEPGVDKGLTAGLKGIEASVYEKLRISVEKHKSAVVAIAGHFDCAANPVSDEEHAQQIKDSAEIIWGWNLGVRVIGLYVNEWNAVDVIYDSDEGFETQPSFL